MALIGKRGRLFIDGMTFLYTIQGLMMMSKDLCDMCGLADGIHSKMIHRLNDQITDIKQSIDSTEHFLLLLQSRLASLENELNVTRDRECTPVAPTPKEPDTNKWNMADVVENEKKFIDALYSEVYGEAPPITIKKQSIEEMVRRALKRIKPSSDDSVYDMAYKTTANVLLEEGWSAKDIFDQGSALLEESYRQCRSESDTPTDAPSTTEQGPFLPITVTVNGKQVSRIYVGGPDISPHSIIHAALGDKSVKDWLKCFDESTLDFHIQDTTSRGLVRTTKLCITAQPAP
jgi:hypothetical protein